MKPKTAFESGNSPPKVSENGAPIQTGLGLEDTKRRIMEAFEKIRQHPSEPSGAQQTPPQTQECGYTEQHKTRFHERTKRLSLAALETSHISTSHKRTNVDCWEISVPSETAEELIKEALGNERTKTRPE